MRDSDKGATSPAVGPQAPSPPQQHEAAALASPTSEARRRSRTNSRQDTLTGSGDIATTNATTTIRLPAVQRGSLRVSYTPTRHTPRDTAALRLSTSNLNTHATTTTIISTPSGPSGGTHSLGGTPQRVSSGRRSFAGAGGGSLHLHQIDKSLPEFTLPCCLSLIAALLSSKLGCNPAPASPPRAHACRASSCCSRCSVAAQLRTRQRRPTRAATPMPTTAIARAAAPALIWLLIWSSKAPPLIDTRHHGVHVGLSCCVVFHVACFLHAMVGALGHQLITHITAGIPPTRAYSASTGIYGV